MSKAYLHKILLHTGDSLTSSSSDSSLDIGESSASYFNVKTSVSDIFVNESKVNFYKPSGVISIKSEGCSVGISSEESSENGDYRPYSATELPEVWGANPLSPYPWNDEDKPVASFKIIDTEYDEAENNDGILTDSTLALACSYLDRCPTTGNYVLCKCNLKKNKLKDITIMAYYNYLQCVNLSYNQLETIDALGQLPYLMYLDVSHNRLTEVLQFRAPFNLTYVDYSFNNIETIRDLTDFWSIVNLNLSYNQIQKISGLENLKYLRHLNLEHNIIECFENLNNLNLLTLRLNNNNISSIEEGDDVGIKTMASLIKLYISHNTLSSLKLFQNVNTLQAISMENNLINDITELYYLRSLLSLTELDLRNNAVSSQPYYYDFCIFNLPSLLFLDGDVVDAPAKVHAFAKFKVLGNVFNTMKLTSILMLLNQLYHPNISPYDLAIDQCPPKIVIFVGPPGSNKGKFVKMLCDLKKQHLQIGVSHTTRQMIDGEQDGVTYHYVSQSEFINLINTGEMLTHKNFLGCYYGLAKSELCKVIGTRKILVFHCDIENAIHLKTIGLRPYLILTLPGNLDTHKKWVAEKYFAQKTEKDPNAVRVIRGKGKVDMEGSKPLDADEFVYYIDSKLDVSADSVSSDSGSLLITNYVDETDLNLLGDIKYSRYDPVCRVSTSSVESNSIPTHDVSIVDRSYSSRIHFIEKPAKVSFAGVMEVDEGAYSPTSVGESVDEEECLSYSTTKLDDDIFIPFEYFDNDNISGFYYNVTSVRVEYLKLANDNIGLFLNSIFTDELLKSLKKSLNLLKEIFFEDVPVSSRFKAQDDPCYNAFLGKRLERYKAEITKPLYDKMETGESEEPIYGKKVVRM